MPPNAESSSATNFMFVQEGWTIEYWKMIDIRKARRLYLRKEKPERRFSLRNFRWVLLFFLSMCFFSSFLKNPTVSISRIVVSTSKPSRALFEDATLFNSSAVHLPQSRRDLSLFGGMKVYVYDLPAKYNSAWLSDERCGRHLFAAEVAIHLALMKSDVRTLDPWKANFFFVPVYVSCNFSKVNGFPAIGHARSLIGAAVRDIADQFPFWNRSGGADHVFVASHDFGSCFHTMEDEAMADGVPEFLKNSIILQTFGVKYEHPCQAVEHIVIPPYISPESVSATMENSPISGNRDIFAFFRGKMEVHPKNVSGRFYGRQVRTMIWRRYSGDRRFYLRRQRFSGYQSEIARSIFCLCPLGWAPWSPRLVESVVLGCVPVIIADGIQLPFPSAVPWPKISLTVAERDVSKIGDILQHVAATNVTVIQRNLRHTAAAASALLFNVPMVKGDATWQVLVGLQERLHRSHETAFIQ